MMETIATSMGRFLDGALQRGVAGYTLRYSSQAVVRIDLLSLEANVLFGDDICKCTCHLDVPENCHGGWSSCDVTLVPAWWSRM